MWAGWAMLATVTCGVGVWFADSVDANTKRAAENAKQIAVVEERQKTQYVQLREDIAEVKELVK